MDTGYERFMTIMGVVLVIGLAYLAGVLILNDKGLLSIQQARLGTNTILVAITAAYVMLTGMLVVETAEQRQQDIQPAFAVQTEAMGVKVTNVGNGPALQTDITLSIVEKESGDMLEDSRKSAQRLDIPADDFIGFMWDATWTEEISAVPREVPDNYELRFKGSYTDLYQNERQIEPRTYPISLSEQKTVTRFFETEQTYLRELSEQFDTLNGQMDLVIEALRDEEQ